MNWTTYHLLYLNHFFLHFTISAHVSSTIMSNNNGRIETPFPTLIKWWFLLYKWVDDFIRWILTSKIQERTTSNDVVLKFYEVWVVSIILLLINVKEKKTILISFVHRCWLCLLQIATCCRGWHRTNLSNPFFHYFRLFVNWII